MDSVKAVVDWVPPAITTAIISGLLLLIGYIAVKVAGVIKFVVNKTYTEIMTMLKQIQEKFVVLESQLHDSRIQMKDGINELKLQMSGLVPSHEYHEFSREIRHELSALREKIARLEDR